MQLDYATLSRLRRVLPCTGDDLRGLLAQHDSQRIAQENRQADRSPDGHSLVKRRMTLYGELVKQGLLGSQTVAALRFREPGDAWVPPGSYAPEPLPPLPHSTKVNRRQQPGQASSGTRLCFLAGAGCLCFVLLGDDDGPCSMMLLRWDFGSLWSRTAPAFGLFPLALMRPTTPLMDRIVCLVGPNH